MDAEQSGIRHEFRKERLQPDDAKAFAFDLVDHRAGQAVIAQRLATDTREKGERPRIRPKPGKRRPTHMARHDNLFHSLCLRKLERLARGTKPDPFVRCAGDGIRVGLTFDGNDEEVAARGATGIDAMPGKIAATGKDPKLGSPAYRGSVSQRLDVVHIKPMTYLIANGRAQV